MNKKIKNKEKIRATITESARALTIGGIGSLGSYAYFTDKAEAKKDLVVTIGNIVEPNSIIDCALKIDISNGNHDRR